MKIIGVSGGSGAGKSTVSKRLSEILPNALLINLDNFMHEESNKYEQEILKKIHKEKDENVYSYNYYHESLENIKDWVSIIKDGVIKKVEDTIKNEGSEKEYVIVDWVFLPLCQFFSKCDYTICIKADYDRRLTRLIKRLKDRTIYKEFNGSYWSYKPEIIESRVKYTALNDFGYKSKCEIYNDGDLNDLYNKVDEFLKNENLVKTEVLQ